VQDVEVDLEHDRFDVTFDAKLAKAADFVAEIKKIGFDAVVVDPPTTDAAGAHEATTLDVEQLPDDLRTLLTQANKANKMVLLQFTGPH